jgi:hypothetical protein
MRPVASVHMLSAASTGEHAHPKARLDLEQMHDAARADRFGVHRLVDDPASADIILFVETSWAAGYYYGDVRSHPVFREFRPKCYLFSATDKVVPFLPGVFASIEGRWYWPAWTRSGYYPGVRERGDFRYEADRTPSHLFSFIGAGFTHTVRQRILELEHPSCVLIDSHAEAEALEREGRPRMNASAYVQRYVDSVLDSAFVLCPRGGGTSTFRIFEAMMLGRAPVIVSDQWVPPQGPDWESFSLRIAEDEVASVPAQLESRAGEATRMGREARRAWLDWFSEETAFHRTVGWCLELQSAAPARAGARRYTPYIQMLRPYHAARAVAKRFGHGRGEKA